MSHPSAFKTPEGEATYLAAHDAALRLWPVAYEEMNIPTRFGLTHVVDSGPKDAPALVLLHGYMATLIMWLPNIQDFSKDYRVYAIDVMGQPSKSIPGEPIRNEPDYVAWLTATLNALNLDRISLAGVSFGGWLALTYAVAAPDRVQKLVLLSAGGILPIAMRFRLRGMLMVFFPKRFTVNWFVRWAGLTDASGEMDARPVFELMYLGMKHFRMPQDTTRVAARPLSDDELRRVHVPVLLLMGDHEVLCDPTRALSRARRLIPNFDGDLVPRSSHGMCFTQHRIVDLRVLDFLKGTKPKSEDHAPERVVA